MVKKIFKIVVIVALVAICIVLFFWAFLWGSMKWSRYSAKKEAAIYQKEVCDTIKTVEGNFSLKLNGFSKKDLSKIHFYIQQDKLLIKDTVINFVPKDDFETQTVNLPFAKLNIKDRVIVYVGKRYYELSGFTYKAGFNYGMFGPVGECHCGHGGFETINGQSAGSGWLIKQFGIVNYQLAPW